MKRQRRASGGSPDIVAQPAVVGLQAMADPAKGSSSATARHRTDLGVAESGPDGRVWARYIDSRMKQFCCR